MSRAKQQQFSILVGVLIVGTIMGIKFFIGNTLFTFIKQLLFQ